MVSRDKYNKVCTELDGALLREKQAEDLLREQGEQLLSLGKQLEAKHRDESSRELSLAESARELCETKLELSKRTHEMRGLSRMLEELQVEKSKLQQSATHADISARCAVRDGDLVCCYVKTVNNAVENFKNQLIYSPSTVNSLMLPQVSIGWLHYDILNGVSALCDFFRGKILERNLKFVLFSVTEKCYRQSSPLGIFGTFILVSFSFKKLIIF